MCSHQKIEQPSRESENDSHTLEPLRLFFVGDLPTNNVLNVPKATRQSKIFDQFAHREMARRMRSKNALDFKPLSTLDSCRLEYSQPKPTVVRAAETRLDHFCSGQTSFNSYLLKEKLSQVRARLPTIFSNYSVASVFELVGSSPKQQLTPVLPEEESTPRLYQQKKKPERVRCSMMLPQISESSASVKLDQHDTLSTECQSPAKLPPTNSFEQKQRQPENPDTTLKIKRIVEDIVAKVKRKNQCSLEANVDSAVLQPKEERSAVTEPIKKGYIVHDKSLQLCLAKLRSKVAPAVRRIPPATVSGVSADKYCILNLDSLEFVVSSRAEASIEIASLSKVVTALLSILVCRKFSVNIREHRHRVSDQAVEMPGTSAELQVGDVLTVEELLYALMLPSGNDAAAALAECIGRIIQKHKKKPSLLPPAKTFVRHMNILYKELLLDNSLGEEHVFQNPSGLCLNPNKTSALQITVVAAIAIHNETFMQIVCTKELEASIKNERYGLVRRLTWKNTNKLLWKNWKGVKTGTTETAGHCFIGCYQDHLISVFDCATLNKRFTDAERLLEWLKQHR